MGFYDPNLHLLLDDRELYQVYRVRRVLGKLDRMPGPVLQSDSEWEKGRLCQMWGSVYYDEDSQKFQAWYLSYDPNTTNVHDITVIAYAESHDGIVWNKPDLGLFELKGSKQNNIVIKFDPSFPVNSCDGGAVIVEKSDESHKRYKFIGYCQDDRKWARNPKHLQPEVTDEEVANAELVTTHYLIHSTDGIHWDLQGRTRMSEEIGCTWSGRDLFRLTYDEYKQEYMMTAGSSMDATDTGVRAGAMRRGKGIKEMGEFTPFLLLDEEDGYGSFGQFHVPGLLFNYGNRYVGLLDYISDEGRRVAVYLMTSKDGTQWDRLFRDQAFLGPGADATWDADMINPAKLPIPKKANNFQFKFDGNRGIICAVNSVQNPPILKDDKLFFYYTVRKVVQPGAGNLQLNPTTSMTNGIGLATMPRDRFAGLTSVAGEYGGESGFFTTSPITASGKKLFLNVELTHPDGWVKVELKDGNFEKPAMKVCAGYSEEDSIRIAEGGTRLEVKWKGQEGLGEWEGRKVALKVIVSGATVYSYSFA